MSLGPRVELSTYSVNFMQVEEGCSGTKTLEIINNSNIEAVYEVGALPQSVCLILYLKACIKPKMEVCLFCVHRKMLSFMILSGLSHIFFSLFFFFHFCKFYMHHSICVLEHSVMSSKCSTFASFYITSGLQHVQVNLRNLSCISNN